METHFPRSKDVTDNCFKIGSVHVKPNSSNCRFCKLGRNYAEFIKSAARVPLLYASKCSMYSMREKISPSFRSSESRGSGKQLKVVLRKP